MAWTWDITPAPAVGAKLTAAGFGAQVDGAVAELQAAVDAVTGGSAGTGASSFRTALLAVTDRTWLVPGGPVPGMTQTATSVASGATGTVAASPGSGRRVVKGLTLGSSSACTCVVTAAGATIANLNLGAGQITSIDLCLPLTSAQSLTITPTGATVAAVATYGDRSDTVVDIQSIVSSGTIYTASGSARTVGQLWIGNTSATVAATFTLTLAGATLPAVSLSGGGVFTVDSAVGHAIGTSTSISVSAGAVNCFAAGV